MQGHIRKRGDSWQVAVYVGKEGKKRKYKYKSFKRERDAQRFRTELLHQIHNNNYFDPGQVTFGQYLDRWMEDYCLPRLAPRTYKRYKEIVDLHIKPDLGLILLSRLQPLDLQRHYSKMLSRGRIGNKYKEQKGLSPTTVLFHHRIIHKALRQAVKWQLVGRNVADAVEPPSRADMEFEIISKEVLNKILEEIRINCPVLVLPILLAATTGMRRGEVLGLQWKDFNPKTRRIGIKQQLQRIDGKLTLRPVKT
ncbi:MAG: Arm DNA-binding domain-containing protein, partial [Peptococcaceae bacterium]|nr:Arm DNA-binding domain-containing protein [Peptococcaceae bacterium]